MQYSTVIAVLSLALSASALPQPQTGTDDHPKPLLADNAIQNVPNGVTCGNTGPKFGDPGKYDSNAIQRAIDAAVGAINANDPIPGAQKNKKKPAPTYPHQNRPGDGNGKDSPNDYAKPDCTPSGEGQYGFMEYPIMRDESQFSPGQDQGPDRVLFQYVTDNDQSVAKYDKISNGLKGNFKKAVYCGIAQHNTKVGQGRTDPQWLGTFSACKED